MALPTFDTYAYIKTLIRAGISEKQAEAQANANALIFQSMLTNNLATKEDIIALKQELKDDMSALQQRVKDDMTKLYLATKEDSNHLRLEVLGLNAKMNTYGIIISVFAGFLTVTSLIHVFFPTLHL